MAISYNRFEFTVLITVLIYSGVNHDHYTYYNMLASVRDLITAAKGRNETVEQLVESDAFKAIDEQWGKGFLKGPVFINLVFPSTE